MVEKKKRTPEARRASAQKYADRCVRLGMMFHAAQQEAYNEWEALDDWADGQEAVYNSWESLEERITMQAGQVTDLGTFTGNQLTLLVLSLLEERQMYAYQLCQIIRERSNDRYELKFSTLYPLLHGFEKNGYIVGSWKTSPDGSEQKYFRLTNKGLQVLAKEQKALGGLDDIIPGWQRA